MQILTCQLIYNSGLVIRKRIYGVRKISYTRCKENQWKDMVVDPMTDMNIGLIIPSDGMLDS